MIVLDTNVVSELVKVRPARHVEDWAWRQNEDDLYLCVPVVAEMAFGGYRIWLRDRSRRYLDSLDDLITGRFRDRLLQFDIAAALRHGQVRALREAMGRSVGPINGDDRRRLPGPWRHACHPQHARFRGP